MTPTRTNPGAGHRGSMTTTPIPSRTAQPSDSPLCTIHSVPSGPSAASTLLIAPGEVVAVLGPNGAGKSTTIDMLLGLTRPDAGTAALFGVDPVHAVQAGGSARCSRPGRCCRTSRSRNW